VVPLVGFQFAEAALDYLETITTLKIRKQVIKKAKALHMAPHPVGSIMLKGSIEETGEPVYRERSGDYRILYVVRENPNEVIILDIDHRKDVYK